MPLDKKKAAECFQKAAEQGVAWAQFNLGLMYYKGDGVKMNKITTYNWWTKAAIQKHEQAQKFLNALCKESPQFCK